MTPPKRKSQIPVLPDPGAPATKKPSQGVGSTGAASLMVGGTGITIPTNSVSLMMRSPYNLTFQQARALNQKYPNGYTMTYNKTVAGAPLLENYTPGSLTEFKAAIDKMKVDFGAVKGAGTQAAANILTSWGIPSAGKSTLINDSTANAWNLITGANFDPGAVPSSLWGTGGIVMSGTAAKAVNSMTPNEIQMFLGEQSNAANSAASNRAAILQYRATLQAGVTNTTALEKANSIDNVMNTLDNWGLNTPEMQRLVQTLITNDGVINQNALLNTIRQTKSYADAFPGLIARNTKLGPGGEHMTESQYQNYVTTISNMVGQYGLPRDFVSKAEIGQMVANNVAPTEAEARIAKGYLAYKTADEQTKAILQKQYGIGPNLGAAYFLNPQRAQGAMERDIAQATLQAYAGESGLRGFNEADASDLFSKMRLTGVTNQTGALADPYSTYTMAQAKNDLLTAAKNQPLTVANPGAQAPTVNTNTLLGAQIAGFGGTNQVAAQTAVERAAQARVAPFEKGGGPESDAKGVIGAGSAAT